MVYVTCWFGPGARSKAGPTAKVVLAGALIVTDRSASRSCVMDTLFVVFPLELIADVGDVVIDEVAKRFWDGVPAGNADGVTTKPIGNV
jgi:hypothetical protein